MITHVLPKLGRAGQRDACLMLNLATEPIALAREYRLSLNFPTS
jgi:hypothetical protein